MDITKRLGNVKNELGVLYMNKAAALIDSGAEPSLEERELWKKSFSNFDRGIRTFDIIEDRLVEVVQFRSVCSRVACVAGVIWGGGRVREKGREKRRRLCLLRRLAVECNKSKTNVVTLTNHNRLSCTVLSYVTRTKGILRDECDDV